MGSLRGSWGEIYEREVISWGPGMLAGNLETYVFISAACVEQNLDLHSWILRGTSR